MPTKLITNFFSGSVNDSSLAVFGDPNSGTLFQTGYKSIRDYIVAGITGSSGTVDTGSLLLTASFNAYTSSTNVQIVNVFASESNYLLTSSFNTAIGFINASTASYNAYVLSNNSQNLNIYASESNYLPTASFLSFSSSYHADSSSFVAQIQSITGSGGGVNIVAFNNYTSSATSQSLNIFASQSNYETIVSFNTYSASTANTINNVFASESNYLLNSAYSSDSSSFNSRINTNGTNFTNFSSSYVNDSSSFNSRINSGGGGGSTNTGSLLPTASFLAFSSSYVTDSSSFNSGITNTSSSLYTFSSSLSSGSVFIGGNAPGKTLTVGTRDNNPIIFLCNGSQVMEIYTDGHIGFGNGSGGDPAQFVYFQGTSRFDGAMTIGANGGISVSSGVNFTSLAANNAPNNTGFYWGMNNNFNAANSTKDFFALAGTSQLSSGTGETITQLHIIPTINNTGGAGHLLRGVCFDPINTSLTGTSVIGFENKSGDNYFNSLASGSTVIGTMSGSACAILKVVSTTQGFLPPSMSTAQMNAIASPIDGLMVYNATEHAPFSYNGQSWNAISSRRPHTIFVPTGSQVISPVNNSINIINPSASLGTLTLVLPSTASLVNNDTIYFNIKQQVSTIVYSGSGATLVGLQASASAGQRFDITYDAATTSWY